MGAPKAGEPVKGISFRDVKDGTSNTIAIVEASDELAVEWTKPVEWKPDASDPFNGLLGMRPNGFLTGFADGSTHFIAKNLDPKILNQLFSHSDGNVVGLPVDPPSRPRGGPPSRVPPPGPIPATPMRP